MCEVYVFFWSQLCLEIDLHFVARIWITSSTYRVVVAPKLTTVVTRWMCRMVTGSIFMSEIRLDHLCLKYLYLNRQQHTKGYFKSPASQRFSSWSFSIPRFWKYLLINFTDTLAMSSGPIEAVTVDSVSFNGTFVAIVLRGMVHRL